MTNVQPLDRNLNLSRCVKLGLSSRSSILSLTASCRSHRRLSLSASRRFCRAPHNIQITNPAVMIAPIGMAMTMCISAMSPAGPDPHPIGRRDQIKLSPFPLQKAQT